MDSEYSEKLKDPRWQKKRLEILSRDNWVCQSCFDNESTLVVHHRRYLGDIDPWDYPDNLLVTLCEECHQRERDERFDAEQDLLGVLREKFFVPQIQTLFEGFMQLNPLHLDAVVADAYAWALSSGEIQHELIERYLNALRAKAAAEKLRA